MASILKVVGVCARWSLFRVVVRLGADLGRQDCQLSWLIMFCGRRLEALIFGGWRQSAVGGPSADGGRRTAVGGRSADVGRRTLVGDRRTRRSAIDGMLEKLKCAPFLSLS